MPNIIAFTSARDRYGGAICRAIQAGKKCHTGGILDSDWPCRLSRPIVQHYTEWMAQEGVFMHTVTSNDMEVVSRHNVLFICISGGCVSRTVSRQRYTVSVIKGRAPQQVPWRDSNLLRNTFSWLPNYEYFLLAPKLWTLSPGSQTMSQPVILWRKRT